MPDLLAKDEARLHSVEKFAWLAAGASSLAGLILMTLLPTVIIRGGNVADSVAELRANVSNQEKRLNAEIVKLEKAIDKLEARINRPPIPARMIPYDGTIKDVQDGRLTLTRENEDRSFTFNKEFHVVIDEAPATVQDLARKKGFPATVFTIGEDSREAISIHIHSKK